MSLADWKATYYPIPANCPDGETHSERDRVNPVITTELQATDHSLTKWIGLRPTTRDEYQLKLAKPAHEGSDLADDSGAVLPITATTCALCRFHNDDCSECMLAKIRGGLSCCDSTQDWHADLADHYDESKHTSRVPANVNPYDLFRYNGDPEAMIDLLKDAKEHLLTAIQEEPSAETQS